LLDLLELLAVNHDGSLDSIVKATQSSWLRPVGHERWDIPASKNMPTKKIFVLLERLGLLETQHAKKNNYNYALVLGANYTKSKQRLSFLLEQYNRDVKFDKIYILGSSRLITNDEKKYFNKNIPTTEYAMLTQLTKDLLLEQKIKNIPIKILNTPQKRDKSGAKIRANTGDTIKQWLSLDLKPGSLLVISNQPYNLYQDAVIKTLVPDKYKADTIGPASDEKNISVHLDNLARVLYQNQQLITQGSEH
jgi:hypothetical protein